MPCVTGDARSTATKEGGPPAALGPALGTPVNDAGAAAIVALDFARVMMLRACACQLNQVGNLRLR